MAAQLSRFQQLLDELGVPLDTQLFELALTHRSYAYENGGIPTNERLEFLGDAVLGIVVTEHLYLTFPDYPEGRLAKLRAAVVNAVALADVARGLDIGPMVKLGRGETTTGGHDKTSILADTMEALIGGIFLTGGMGQAESFVHHVFDPLVTQADQMGAGLDWKTSLQEVCANNGHPMPTYRIEESGPDHDKHFVARAVVNGVEYGTGEGRNKKQAEQEAAGKAFTAIQEAQAAQAAAREALGDEPVQIPNEEATPGA
ncbi:ribonuclease III [Luteococcus sp. Sow4_B9]|uniref:ribonuclease III n=1 Tax=Luteococcus sp. Sow4_B9 TaxID=3438792 RepID=UPI003F963990